MPRRSFGRALPVVPLDAPLPRRSRASPTRTTPPASSRRSTARSTTCFAGRAAAIVTCPIAKKVLYDAGFRFPGHTEYLAHLASPTDRQDRHAGDDAGRPGAAHRAGHHPYPARRGAGGADDGADRRRRRASSPTDLRERFGIDKPRLAVAGLNPHAGEGGAMGSEDDDDHRAGGRGAAGRGHRRVRAPARRHDVPRSRRAPPTTRRSACITTRR